MKQILVRIALLISLFTYLQNITLNNQIFTPQQLIENILIDSDYITNIAVTNIVDGNFNTSDESYSFFNALGTTFTFEYGLVLITQDSII